MKLDSQTRVASKVVEALEGLLNVTYNKLCECLRFLALSSLECITYLVCE